MVQIEAAVLNLALTIFHLVVVVCYKPRCVSSHYDKKRFVSYRLFTLQRSDIKKERERERRKNSNLVNKSNWGSLSHSFFSAEIFQRPSKLVVILNGVWRINKDDLEQSESPHEKSEEAMNHFKTALNKLDRSGDVKHFICMAATCDHDVLVYFCNKSISEVQAWILTVEVKESGTVKLDCLQTSCNLHPC